MIEYTEKGWTYPARLWLPLEEIEHAALDQIRNVSKHPELADSLAIMPDCHVGYGVSIGSVLLTKGSVIPNAVGVDIGCGMGAIRTGLTLEPHMNQTFWRAWAERVAKAVPTGFSWHSKAQKWQGFDEKLIADSEAVREIRKNRAASQLGTLGGGNHFLEAQVDEENRIWVMVHSGSRKIGMEIAKHYHDLAIAESEKRGLNVGKDLASLSFEHDTAHNYVSDMIWAIDYAQESRHRMLRAMLSAFSQQVSYDDSIECAHNYAIPLLSDRSVAYGEGNGAMAIHRKGATNATLDSLGIIPGSMNGNSYIVQGKGNPDSHSSCSHGAGRTMGRNAAKRLITGETKEDALAQLGAMLEGTHTAPNLSHADEAPHAYKPIEIVMDRQKDLVDIIHVLKPLITVKGGGRDEG